MAPTAPPLARGDVTVRTWAPRVAPAAAADEGEFLATRAGLHAGDAALGPAFAEGLADRDRGGGTGPGPGPDAFVALAPPRRGAPRRARRAARAN